MTTEQQLRQEIAELREMIELSILGLLMSQMPSSAKTMRDHYVTINRTE